MNGTQIEERLAGLERRLNRYRAVAAALGVAVIGLIGVAATGSGEISTEVQTRKLVVVNNEGRPAFSVAPNAAGCTLFMHNHNGQLVFAVTANNAGTELVLADGQGFHAAQLTTGTAGGRLEIQSRDGQRQTITPQGAVK